MTSRGILLQGHCIQLPVATIFRYLFLGRSWLALQQCDVGESVMFTKLVATKCLSARSERLHGLPCQSAQCPILKPGLQRKTCRVSLKLLETSDPIWLGWILSQYLGIASCRKDCNACSLELTTRVPVMVDMARVTWH